MLLFFYDTETQKLPNWHEPSGDPNQPHLVQAAASLIDLEKRKTIASIDLIAMPDGWAIPDHVAEIHGINTDYATKHGVDEKLIVDTMYQMWRSADKRVAHNESFDARIMRIGLKRFGYSDDVADAWKAAPAECTAKMATPICNIPPTEKMVKSGRNFPKKPTMGEAYKHFFGRELENAHTALADVNACIDVYFAIKDQEAAAA